MTRDVYPTSLGLLTLGVMGPAVMGGDMWADPARFKDLSEYFFGGDFSVVEEAP